MLSTFQSRAVAAIDVGRRDEVERCGLVLRYGLKVRLAFAFDFCNGKCKFLLFRQLAAHVLETEPDGAFIVRRSVSQPMSSLVLSVRVPCSHNPSGVSHYLIIHTAKGFKLKVWICLTVHIYMATY